MGDRLVGCASYTMSEFHVRNYMARRPHINQERWNEHRSDYVCGPFECHTSGQTSLKNIMSENLQPVSLRLLLSFYNGEYVIAPDLV